jgi:hypothetical protein
MKYNLAAMARRRGINRPLVTLRTIRATQLQTRALERLFGRMLAPWLAGARARILPVYERELSRRLAHDSADDLGGLADEIAEEVDRLVIELTPDLRAWALGSERVHRHKWTEAARAILQVSLESMLGPEDMRETIEAFLVRSTSLIRDVNEQARGRIMDSIIRGIQQRTPTAKVAKEISEATGMARKRAKRIAAHQSVNLHSALNRERRRQAGLDVWKWIHSRKLHPRQEHVERDGKLFSDQRRRQGKLPSGQQVLPAPEDLPGVLPNCGCSEQAVLILDGEALG